MLTAEVRRLPHTCAFCTAALEVYVRRAYRAYVMQNISHDLSCPDYRIVQWRFLLPTAHPNMQFAGYGKVCVASTRSCALSVSRFD